MMDLLGTQSGRFRILAFAEGTSLLIIIFITMPIKYLLDIPEPNKVLGLLHGLFFIMYVFAVIQIKIEKAWKMKTMLLALLASVLPYGTFYFTSRLLPKEKDQE